jgi:hypothetical protein
LFQDKVRVFSIFRECGLINEALYKPTFTVFERSRRDRSVPGRSSAGVRRSFSKEREGGLFFAGP